MIDDLAFEIENGSRFVQCTLRKDEQDGHDANRGGSPIYAIFLGSSDMRRREGDGQRVRCMRDCGWEQAFCAEHFASLRPVLDSRAICKLDSVREVIRTRERLLPEVPGAGGRSPGNGFHLKRPCRPFSRFAPTRKHTMQDSSVLVAAADVHAVLTRRRSRPMLPSIREMLGGQSHRRRCLVRHILMRLRPPRSTAAFQTTLSPALVLAHRPP